MPDENQGARPSTKAEKPKKVNGGARNGAGRKKGGSNEKTKARIERAERAIEKAGVTPLEIMLLAMQQDWAKANNETLEDGARAIHRQHALNAAKDAAPYVHPKLQPVDGSGNTALIVDASLTVKFA
jgi:hypothetical protein